MISSRNMSSFSRKHADLVNRNGDLTGRKCGLTINDLDQFEKTTTMVICDTNGLQYAVDTGFRGNGVWTNWLPRLVAVTCNVGPF